MKKNACRMPARRRKGKVFDPAEAGPCPAVREAAGE